MALFSLKNLSFTYPKGPAIFENLNIEIKKGEIVGVLGPNGCGKSTLFDIMTLHHKIKRGQVLYNGLPINEGAFFRDIGCVFQNISLDPYMTVRENLMMQGKLHGISSNRLVKKIDSLAKQFDLILDRQVKLLSGGYARRSEIAKALIHDPVFILLDEPSAGLDPKSKLELLAWLNQVQHDSNATVVWISHLTDEVQKMDRVIMLSDGKVVCDGVPSELVGQLDCYCIQAKIKNPNIVDQINTVGRDISVQGEKIQFRIDKSQLKEVMGFLIPSVEHFTYREPNLEDVYLEKTGVYFS